MTCPCPPTPRPKREKDKKRKEKKVWLEEECQFHSNNAGPGEEKKIWEKRKEGKEEGSRKD